MKYLEVLVMFSGINPSLLNPYDVISDIIDGMLPVLPKAI